MDHPCSNFNSANPFNLGRGWVIISHRKNFDVIYAQIYLVCNIDRDSMRIPNQLAGSGNGLVPLAIKPLTEPLLARGYVAIWRQYTRDLLKC